MKTKIGLSVLATVFLAATSVAQQKTTFGIRAGVNFQNITGKDINDDDPEFRLKPGFHVGVNAEIPVGVDFYVQPGLLFSQKGAKSSDTQPDAKFNLSYIEVPVNFLYKPTLGAGKLLLGFGPYVAVGVGGSYKPETGPDIDYEFDNEITLADVALNPYRAKRIDAGANLLVGYEMSNKVSLQLNAGLGLVNMYPEITNGPNDLPKYKNTGFGLSLGYRF